MITTESSSAATTGVRDAWPKALSTVCRIVWIGTGSSSGTCCRSVNATVPVQTPTLRVADCGDAAIRVTASGTDAERRWRAVHHLADVLTAADIPGRSGVVPTYESVLIEFDAVHTDHAAISRVVTRVADELRHADPVPPAARTFRVPVAYGGSHGPDLDFVAEHLDTGADDVIDRHTALPLTIRCLGAPAGSPMMDARCRNRRPMCTSHPPERTLGPAAAYDTIAPHSSERGRLAANTAAVRAATGRPRTAR